MKRIIMLMIVSSMLLSLTAAVSAGWQDELYSGKEPEIIDRNYPSYLDLDDIDCDISYPKDSDYLDEYKIKYVKSSSEGGSVYALHGLNDGKNWKSLARKVRSDTKVVVIAEHSFKQDGVKNTYCCCIYEDEGNEYAGWIFKKFLVNEPSQRR